MSGHSKWANIKHKKAKLDAQRGKVFTRITKEITISAREGGGDPGGNSRLRLCIDKAKAANMPQDNIARAIKKGTGELEGVRYESITYEGYGVAGMAIIVEVLTDNKNRAVADLRHMLSKQGGHLAESGSVGWMFEQKGLLVIKIGSKSEDEVLESLINCDIDDIIVGDNIATVICKHEDLYTVKKEIEDAGFKVESADLSWIAKNQIELSKEDEEKAYKILDAIDNLDDVQEIYTNLK